MKINGVETLEYGAEQWNVSMSYVSVKNESEFLQNALVPYLTRGYAGMKKIKVDVLIKGESRQGIWQKGNRLIYPLLKPAVVELDGFANYFQVVLTNASQAESCIRRFHKATLELTGYEYGPEENVTLSGQREGFVENPGSLETPARMEIMPKKNVSSMTISGISRAGFLEENRDIVVKNLKKDEILIVDWKTGRIQTEGGVNRFSDVEFWGFPSLLPGSNFIELSTESVDVGLSFNPLFL